MPQVRLSPKDVRDLQRLRLFLQTKNQEAAKRAITAIRTALKTLAISPLAHMPDDETPNYRIMQIPFGSSGYTVWYHYKTGADVTIVSIKHQKEGSYENDL